MRVGISTACFYPNINTEDTLDIISSLGFRLCEIFLETDYEMEEKFCMKLRQKADRLGLHIYSVHGFSGAFEPFLFDRYPRRKNDMEKKFKKMCRAAEILEAECYVFHGLRNTSEKINPKEIALGMDNLINISKEHGVKLAWENVSWCRSNNIDFVREVTENMKEEIKFTLDIKQAVRSGKEPMEYLEFFDDRIFNIHINDADKNNTCLLPGQGNIDLKKIVRRVQKVNLEIPFIIEVYNENFKSLDELSLAKKYVESLEW
ncbi:AP endonuclease [Fervidicella metallireducens AeB]|uniref:AP endonuclease n=1 Tax=Fervidicella metallireducens AeB TaxID=1403537 RepID=A0A017RYK8_9CLOT|nr:sugar phosphate isomerase/epimerase [Fervidicella metallireducens]EYE89010.1 AP endonuclease [Fervidicella metallireducens AeB]